MVRPSLRAAFANWRKPDWPWRGKLRLALANNLLKLRRRSSCCGHLGEPGC